MVNVDHREIGSVKKSTHPWYELDVDAEAGKIQIVDDYDGGTEFDMTSASASLSEANASEPAALSITENGEFVAWNLTNETAPAMRAHLAWWDGADTLTVLKFVEQE